MVRTSRFSAGCDAPPYRRRQSCLIAGLSERNPSSLPAAGMNIGQEEVISF